MLIGCDDGVVTPSLALGVVLVVIHGDGDGDGDGEGGEELELELGLISWVMIECMMGISMQ